MNDRWSDRLSAYLDDELDIAERSAIEAHLASCDECAGTLEALREVKTRARTLEDRAPERNLWTGIEARITAASAGAAASAGRAAGTRAAAGAAHADASSTRVIRPARRIDFSLPQALAAAAALIVISAGAMWWAMRASDLRVVASHGGAAGPVARNDAGPAPGGASSGTAVSSPGTSPSSGASEAGLSSTPGPAPSSGNQQIASVASLSSAPGGRELGAGGNTPIGFDSSYDEAVAELQRTLEQHRTELDSSTVRIVEQNLAVIDRAILQARRALAADPASPYLHQHLALQMKLKLDLLRRTAAMSGA
ncbi:MAG TPA: anti-sigma factor [Candidatus Udaeobacter sp.]|jgi:anti-sigma factor RsiW|nr:anti-sigma factor [Candidatus Udaeobacter sp.]